MQLVVITPLHEIGNAFIEAAYSSLKEQSLVGWRWVILENNGGLVPEALCADGRVSVWQWNDVLTGIGQLKAKLCELAMRECGEEIGIVELDCDDLLEPRALETITRAFEQGADFVYSDFAEFKWNADGSVQSSWDYYPYSTAFGWSSYPVKFGDHVLHAMRAPVITPQNIRYIDWAPNHVRAWRSDFYKRVGGHDVSMAVCDDHDLIVRMFLAGGKFTHIPECLYGYRVHAGNTVATRNAAIRDATAGVYNKYIFKLGEYFAKSNGLLAVDLCGALGCPEGYRSIDKHAGAHIVCDLDGTWSLPDSSVGMLRACDAVEHLRDPIHTMNEAYRVLAPGGFMIVSVPSTDGRGAFQDPTHISYWNQNSFWYYTDRTLAKYIPRFVGRFQLIKNVSWFPSKWHEENNIPYAEAHLLALKDGYKPYGVVNI